MEDIIREIEGKRFDKAELLDKVDGDEEVLDLLFDSMKSQVPEYLENIGEAIEVFKTGKFPDASVLDKLRSAAHTIKGSAYNLCFHRMGNIAKAIEFTTRALITDTGNTGYRERLIKLDLILNDEWKELLLIMK